MATSKEPGQVGAGELFGTGSGGNAPAVYARAAVLTEDGSGRPTLSGDLLSLAFGRMKRGEGDMDIVLVAGENPDAALLMRLPPGMVLVGIVAEGGLSSPLPEGSRLAVVTGVADARNAIPEGGLLIVEGRRGRVLVEPPAEAFALLQTEAARPRVRLGEAHLPAQTMAGRIVPVWAFVRDAADISSALVSGANGFALEAGGDLLPDISDDEVLSDDVHGDSDEVEITLRRLAPLLAEIGGGDLLLAAPLTAVNPLFAVRLATQARLRWLLSPGDLPVSFSELREELEVLAAEENDADRHAALPELVADFTDLTRADAIDREKWLGGNAVLFSDTVAAQIPLADTFDFPPIGVYLRGIDDPDAFAATVAVASWLVTTPDLAARVKEFVREQEY